MNLLISHLSQTPIYEQLKDQIREAVLSGKLPPGEALPSIRALAKELSIGIITVKRAYDDLCAEGLLISLQGRGVFVQATGGDALRQQRQRELKRRLLPILQYCKGSAIDKDELITLIEALYQEDMV